MSIENHDQDETQSTVPRWLIVAIVFVSIVILAFGLAADAFAGHVGGQRCAQQGKDCVWYANGSARVARDCVCPHDG